MNYVSEALEQQHAAEHLMRECIKNPEMRPGVKAQERLQWRTDVHSLSLAEPFYWNDRTTNLISQAMNDFRLEEIRCTRNLLYVDVGWHWFADKGPFEIEDFGTRRMLTLKAITWYWFGGYSPSGSALGYASYASKPFLGATAWCQSPYSGAVLPTIWACTEQDSMLSTQIAEAELSFQGHLDDRTQWECQQLKRFVACASTFLRQELVTAKVEHLERHARKRLEKSGLKAQGVHVVQLRRTERKEAMPSDGEPRDWQWQWTVRGHVRQQFYRTLNEHLPVYIHPHIKGPEGKPLKPRTTPIYSVTR